MPTALKAALCLFLLPPLSAAPEKEFQKIGNCTLVPADWADGDSFPIKKPDGEIMTVRLYGADCIEWHIGDDTDARRLRAQRRYFGITEAKPTAQASIELAKGFGKTAAEKTATLLKQPFTVHTRMQNALGDGKFQRFYAFIECKDGSDLATELVRAGLARAYGVYADGPGDRAKEEYRETLADVELQAAKRGAGVWAATDWDKLPGERHAQREEEQDIKIAQGQAGLPDDFRLNPNTAARDELMKLPRVGEKLANLIIEAREEAPFAKAGDLMRVPGIKQKTLDPIRPHLHFDKP
jgi:DNA uptake protein ComE-like DNA-binding protein